MKKLIIAEKPNLGRTIANALNVQNNRDGYVENDRYIISWTFGHIFKLKDIDSYIGEKRKWNEVPLPFFPKKFEFVLKEDPGIKKQFKILKELINSKNVDEIINAGDAGREGQIIVDIIINSTKTNKKVKRLWIPAQTDETIKRAINQLESNDKYANLYNEGMGRTYMDWLMGINLTRYISLKANALFPVGRVLIPIVKFVYDREMIIKNFVSEKYLTLESNTIFNETELKLLYKKKYNMKEIRDAENDLKKLNSNRAIVKDVIEKEVVLNPKKLFSLSKLQSKLSKEYKINFAKSLEIIQKLYENGYITYPRTNTEYLAEEEKDRVKEIIQTYNKYGLEFKDNKKIFDSSKIEDHSAIIPTIKIPDIEKLSSDERIIFETIKNRFVSVFLKEQAIINQMEVRIIVGDESFNLIGKTIKQEGFLKYENQRIDNKLPYFKVNEEFNVKFELVEKWTVAPKKINEDSLSNYLKNPFRKEKEEEESDDTEEYKRMMKGIEIGTEATRTGIIENAKKYGYISQDNQNLNITKKGIKLIELLDLLNINLYAEKTVEFSVLQKLIYNNKKTVDDIIEKTKMELKSIIDQDIKVEKFNTETDKEIIGKCPKCGSFIYENKKSYYCSNYKEGCKFSLWKESKYFDQILKITKEKAIKLLKGNKAKFKLKSRQGNDYEIYFVIEMNGDYVNFKKGDFVNKNIKNKKK